MKKVLSALPVAGLTALALTLSSCASASDPASAPAPSDSPASPSSPEAIETALPEPSSSSTDAPSQGQPNSWAFASVATIGKFEIPGSTDEGFLDLMKRYDDDVSKVQFINVKVDNREADEEVWVREVRGYDASGKEYMFVDPVEFLDAMFEEDSTKMDYDDEYMKYFDQFQDTASPGEVHEFELITMDELPKEGFSRVIVDTGNLNEVEAVTMEEAKSQGYPLDF